MMNHDDNKHIYIPIYTHIYTYIYTYSLNTHIYIYMYIFIFIARATQKLLQDYKGLQDIIAILGTYCYVISTYCSARLYLTLLKHKLYLPIYLYIYLSIHLTTNLSIHLYLSGMDELSEDDKLTVARARKAQRFMSQPFHVAEVFTGRGE